MKKGTFKGAAIFSVSALALAVSSAANAYTFNVNDTEVTIGGYAKLDMIYDVDDKLGNDVGFANIRTDDEPSSDGHFDMHAEQTRFGIQTATSLKGSVLKTNIEGDFWGGDFRLRHAYGEWNGILAGQTWTNFGDGLGTTPTVDFGGPGGQGNTARQPQLRYTTGGFAVALERPGSLGGDVDDEDEIVDTKSQLPDLTVRYSDGVNGFKYAVSGVVRQLEFDEEMDRQASADANSSDTATGWGVVIEGALEITPAVTVRGSLAHGDGIGNYLNRSPAGPAYLDDDKIKTIEQTGGNIGVSIAAGPGNINASYSIATADVDDYAADSFTGTDSPDETYESLYVNYIWSPVERITYGIEAGLHSREEQDGDDGDAVRIQGMVMYSF